MILSIRSSPFHRRCGESSQTSESDVKQHGEHSGGQTSEDWGTC